MFFERGEMLWRAVALVSGKIVTGKFCIVLHHDPVARDFRNDARGGDAETERVARNERGLRDRKWAHGQSVNEHMLRLRIELRDCAAHGLVRRAEDVDAIDFRDIHNGERKPDLRVRGDFHEEQFPCRGGELLGVVQRSVPESLRQNHRRRDDRPGERTAPGLIHPGHKTQTSRTKLVFMREVAGHRDGKWIECA